MNSSLPEGPERQEGPEGASSVHRAVLSRELCDALVGDCEGCYCDATYGRGGHAKALLERLAPSARVYAVDCDPQAASAAERHAREDERLRFGKARFSELARLCGEWQVAGKLCGLAVDLGVSSPQLDDPERGFSLRPELDGPIDMRMDPTRGESAAQWLEQASPRELERTFREYGDEPRAARIARAIGEARRREPLRRTAQLAQLVARAAGWKGRSRRHPATRVFQAIRMRVNDEPGELRSLLEQSVNLLKLPGGRLAVITFHSLEGRIFKSFLRAQARLKSGPRLRSLGRPTRPSPAEVAANPRSRSAVLRLAEMVA